jgi:predicted alpha/beta-hydrolase family hydrolase
MAYPETIEVPLDDDRRVSGLGYDADANRIGATLVLAHGAGAPQTSPFMVAFATALARRGLDVGTFNFHYSDIRRRVPDSGPELERCYLAAIRVFRTRSPRQPLFIGGKSMGGRIATQVVAAESGARSAVAGLVLLGYPLHPPGRPTELRSSHLSRVSKPMLFIQGSRDAFGTPEELSAILSTVDPKPALQIVDGGDHSFKVRAGSKIAQEDVYHLIEDGIVDWIRETARLSP